MGLFTAFDISASGLTAQRYRMDIISQNVANANTTRTENGDPYVRKVVYFEEKGVRGSDTFSHVLNSVSKNYAGKVGIMVTAPYYNKGTSDGIYLYYQSITSAIKLSTIVYNIPSRTGVNVTPENLARIAQLPFIAGIKEASGNLSQIAEVVRLCPNTAVYSGDDTLALPCYAVGCRGIISVTSNLDVTPVKQIWQLYVNGKPHHALLQFQKFLPFYQSLFRVVNPVPIKYELAKRGLIKNVLRLPLTPIQ